MKVKGFFQSKTVILALVNLVLAILGGLTHRELTYLGQEIVALDWQNISQALISVVMIFVRVFFTSGAKISGLLKLSPTSTTYLFLLLCLGSAGAAIAAPNQPYRAWQFRNRPAEICIVNYRYCLTSYRMGLLDLPGASAKERGLLFLAPVPVE